MGFLGKIFGGSSTAKWNVIDKALTIGTAIGTCAGAFIGASLIRRMARDETVDGTELCEEIESGDDVLDAVVFENETEETK